MEKTNLPDYHGGSIVNLMCSILRELGTPGPRSDYPPLTGLEAGELGRSRHLVVLVIDGLGYGYLLGRHPSSHLGARVRQRLTSVFPSTTASAVTTFLTGTAPQQHAVTGWFGWFRELGVVAATLPFRVRAGGASLGAMGVTPRSVFDQPSVFERIDRRSHILLPREFVDSDYTCVHAGPAERHGYASLSSLFERLYTLLRSVRDPAYIYAYWPELDALAHAHGVGSAAVAEHFEALDAGFADLVRALAGTDTTIIATADHGFIDTSPETVLELADHPVLSQTLRMPLCGEPRVAYCYVSPRARGQFERYVGERLGEQAQLYASEDLLNQGFFGHGEPHPRLRDRIGDYALIMKERYVIRDVIPGEQPPAHVGVHGGLSEDEMYVPLIVAQT
ncbi:MAG: alkaline phosphatase family protein [Gammaproteobacteria bacterium]|nr:alkaline phosphatase family protein [Gammaproteobacteria bacterium]NIR83631.1 alkaline phosphatase family protein [Gammaproteobacteria bacterium]NIR91604.1 alkaline phosphatase family protein [Gammaproteobacteria bacterium]NIU04793.1 alkaline phosphatase family protein [Gammaproteobacteria bacterium]NIV53143.1 PglZ domain-containing protein [Gammaproteobacteria bacterium]